MGAPTNAKVDLQTAADELGVHYQTAYRWVRNGRLDAELVGGKYLISSTDIAELDRARHTSAAPTPPRRAGSSTPPTACTTRSWPATSQPPPRSSDA